MGVSSLTQTGWDRREKLAALGLWSVPGLGSMLFARLKEHAGGNLAAYLDAPLSEWVNAPELEIMVPLRERLARGPSIKELAERTLASVQGNLMRVCFAGDDRYPFRLLNRPDAPPLLFYWGELEGPRRRVAMVGTRHPDEKGAERAFLLAEAAAAQGLGVVSGAAEGIDRVCHLGALNGGGETWAFLGCALDQMDTAQRVLHDKFLEGRGVFFTEFPPGVRSSKQTFPRRNRLIAGASDAVLLVRAGIPSGALYTARYALELGRPTLAMPGEADNPAAAGCNALLQSGHARACLSVDDVVRAAGLEPSAAAPSGAPASLEGLSSAARSAYGALGDAAHIYEELEELVGLESAQLTSALMELELSGLVIRRAGRVFERV